MVVQGIILRIVTSSLSGEEKGLCGDEDGYVEAVRLIQALVRIAEPVVCGHEALQ